MKNRLTYLLTVSLTDLSNGLLLSIREYIILFFSLVITNPQSTYDSHVFILFVLRKPYTDILPWPEVYLGPLTPGLIRNCFVELIRSLINKA